MSRYKVLGLCACVSLGLMACGDGSIATTSGAPGSPSATNNATANNTDSGAESQAELEQRFNSLLTEEPGIHEVPGVDLVGVPSSISQQIRIVENPDALARASAPWQMTVTGAAAQHFKDKAVLRGDVVFGNGCQTCVADGGFSLTVVGFEVISENEIRYDVKPFRIEHAVYGRWDQQLDLTPQNGLNSEGLRTRQQGLLGESEYSYDNLTLTAGVNITGSAGVSFEPNATFSGAFRVKAGFIDEDFLGDHSSCDGHAIDQKKDFRAGVGPFKATVATVWFCVDEFEVSLTTNVFAEVGYEVSVGASVSRDTSHTFLEESLASIPLGSTPLAINVGVEGKAKAGIEVGGEISMSATARADVSVPVGIRAVNGGFSPFVENTATKSADVDVTGEASVVASAGVSMALNASVGINESGLRALGLDDNIEVRFGNIEAGAELTATARYETTPGGDRMECATADIVLEPYVSGALDAELSVDVGPVSESFSHSFWSGRAPVGSTTLFETAIPDSCPGLVKDLNDTFDIDYAAVCQGEAPAGDLMVPDLSRFLSQPCAAMEEPLPACDAERPTDECKGTMRHFFRPFFMGEGMCMGSVAQDDTYEMTWSTGEKLTSSEPRVGAEDSPGGRVFTQTSEFELFASDEFSNLLTSTAPAVLRNPPGTNGCTSQTIYTLEDLGEEYIDVETGEYESGFKPGDTLTLCIRETGALDVTCPNSEVINIPAPRGGTNGSIAACLLGSSCRFFSGG